MKNTFITRENLGQRSTQFIILIAHLVLLKWILYTLYEGGVLPFKTLMFHFTGISIYGALLIRTCAYIYKRQYLKELEQNARDKKLDQ
jgi:apolipoprotein N-acyltransferase